MTLCEERYAKACNDGLIIHYDYDRYVEEGSKSKYDESFLRDLPDKYFLGLPIKKLITKKYSSGLCHSLSLAVGLCFDDFELVTANLALYNEFYRSKIVSYKSEFNHSYVIVTINGERKVIDPVFGIITDIDTYENVFGVQKKYSYKKEELEKEAVIKYIIDNLDVESPLFRNDATMDDFDHYYEGLEKYTEDLENYSNPAEFKLEYYFRRCLKPTSKYSVIGQLTDKMTNEEQLIGEDYSDSDEFDDKKDEYKN